MALIICNECGKKFSDRAEACPNCGCPIQEAERRLEPIIEEKKVIPDFDLKKVMPDIDYKKHINQFKEKIPKFNGKRIIKYLLIALAVIIALSVAGNIFRSWNEDRYDWDEIVLSRYLPEPKSHKGIIFDDTEEHLDMIVYKTDASDYKQYVEECKQKGFKIDKAFEEKRFSAYNKDGYRVSLYYEDYTKEMDIEVENPIKLDSLKWPESGLAADLPQPDSNKGNIEENTDKRFVALVGDMSLVEYAKYNDSCIEKGFKPTNKTKRIFLAENEEGYKIKTEYIGFNMVRITYSVPIYSVSIKADCVENMAMNKYDIDFYIDENLQGSIYHGDSDSYSMNLEKGIYTLKAVSSSDDTISGTVALTVEHNTKIKCKIHCKTSSISLELVQGINPPIINEDLGSMKYSEVVKAYTDAGFTNVEAKPVAKLEPSELSAKSGIVGKIEVGNNTKFDKESSFFADTKITVKYYAGKKLECPMSNSKAMECSYRPVINVFKNAGFTNITAVQETNINKYSVNEKVSEITIDGKRAKKGKKYAMDSKIVVKYYVVRYAYTTADQMMNAVDSNIMQAESKYYKQFVQIKGRIDNIGKSGDFALLPINNRWEFRPISCSVKPEHRERVKNLTAGNIITVRGYVDYVGNWGYSVEVHFID